MIAVDIDALVGQTIGHHLILEPLGAGGMGVVYQARDTRLGRLVALKVMRSDLLIDNARRRRFVREAQTASALNHPNILTIYEIDADAGLDYISMEYVPGGTLAGLIASGPLPAERALRLTAQIAHALDAAHSAGIVHRDLKPSNIMLTADDKVKVVDFGLAKLTETVGAADETIDPLTMTGALVGTAPYMSPEQAEGRPVDARADLFSLGTILYEMLSGRLPFAGSTAASTVAAILRDDPVPIAGVCRGVEQLVERCLHKDPAGRFQSAAELGSAIDACLVPRAERPGDSLAVLPFTNMSGTRDDDFLCEGLAEEIINELTRIRGLRVIARTSSFAVSQMGLDVRQIGVRLGVGHILEGSVRRAGSRVRVTAQLVSTQDGAHLWSERYDRELADVLALEDEIAAVIARRLRGSLARDTGKRVVAAVDVEAHGAYLEGRYYLARPTPDGLARAAASFEQAIARDESFALAFDSLAELHWYLGFFGGAPPRDAFSRSTWYALRALQLDDTLAETHALLGMLRKELDYNWAEVERENRRAFEINQESPLVHLRYAISELMPQGRVDEALVELEGVLRADPLSLFVRWWLSATAYLARQPERMLEEGRHMIALDPTHFLGHWVLGMGLEGTGALSEAIAELERAHELSGGMAFTLGFLALTCGHAGREEDARTLIEAATRAAADSYLPPSAIAFGYAGLREWGSAFEWLDEAIEARDPLVMPIKTFPFLDPVRDDPRYHALLRKMKLE